MRYQAAAAWVTMALAALIGCGKNHAASSPAPSGGTGAAASGDTGATASGGTGATSAGGSGGAAAAGSAAGRPAADGGAGASAGVPSVTVLVTRTIERPRSLAIDDVYVYFSETFEDANQDGQGRIVRVAKDGSGAAEPLGSQSLLESGFETIQTDATHVYWLDYGVTRYEKATGKKETWPVVSPVASAIGHGALLVEEDKVWAADAYCGGLTRFEKATGTGTYAAGTDQRGGGLVSLFASTDDIYCAEVSGLYAWRRADLTFRTIALPFPDVGATTILNGELFSVEEISGVLEDHVWRAPLSSSGAGAATRVGSLGYRGLIIDILPDVSRNRLLVIKSGTAALWLVDPTANSIAKVSLPVATFGDVEQDANHLYAVAAPEERSFQADRIVRITQP